MSYLKFPIVNFSHLFLSCNLEGGLLSKYRKKVTDEKVGRQSSFLAVSDRSSNYEAFREQQLAWLKTMTEEWSEVFLGQIPKDNYGIQRESGQLSPK